MTKLKPREQGDIGELSAMEWLASKGAHIYVPVSTSPSDTVPILISSPRLTVWSCELK
jgi:hypothetical protein